MTVTTGYGGYGAPGLIVISYSPITAPTISGISPNTGIGGTSIVITGSMFINVTGVTIGGVAASYTVNSTTQITAVAPTGEGGGQSVVVHNTMGASNGATFNYASAGFSMLMFGM